MNLIKQIIKANAKYNYSNAGNKKPPVNDYGWL
ncbi:hypothetical protein CPS_0438 [Colwellia psychrerythraea 34H]|uniref:Uncharacterized protein n=1 Tax=Colwellia psychrerythraea (strain 34H / ATCC BAA-681) TaxID=167879 RepID=Q489R8_COLP3|nr:hypothetical protein CPS_0438 [Colwellia psychrerythraea 34H]